MKTPKTLIFDFDGTIANTMAQIVRIYNHLAPKYGTKPISPDTTTQLRTMDMHTLLRTYNISYLKLPFLLAEVKQRLHNELVQTPEFPGFMPAVKTLKSHGYEMDIVTSNTSQNVRHFLQKHNLENYFKFIYTGSNLFGKHHVLTRLFRVRKLEKTNVIYIGDEARDIAAAHRVGIPIISVAWGYNDEYLLRHHSPNGIITAPSELVKAVRKLA